MEKTNIKISGLLTGRAIEPNRDLFLEVGEKLSANVVFPEKQVFACAHRWRWQN